MTSNIHAQDNCVGRTRSHELLNDSSQNKFNKLHQITAK